MMDLDSRLRESTALLGMPWEGFLRLALSAVAAGMIGLERELRGRQAGLRTNILLSVGAALVMLVSISFAQRPWPHSPEMNVTVDPARLAYGIMAGVGLLCAGAVIREENRVSGLTTAASLWCSVAIGLASGMGLYLLTLGCAMLVTVVLWLLQHAEARLPRMKYAELRLRLAWKDDCIAQTVAELGKLGIRVTDLDFRRSEDLQIVTIRVRVGFIGRQPFYAVARKIEADPKIELLSAQNL